MAANKLITLGGLGFVAVGALNQCLYNGKEFEKLQLRFVIRV